MTAKGLPSPVESPMNSLDPLDQIQKGLTDLHKTAPENSITKKLIPYVSGILLLMGGLTTWYQQTQDNDKAIAVLQERVEEKAGISDVDAQVTFFMKYQALHNDKVDATLQALTRKLDILTHEIGFKRADEYHKLRTEMRKR